MRKDLIALVGRLLIASFFLVSAFRRIADFESAARRLEGQGLPVAALLCAAAAALETLGGMSLALGFHARWGASALACLLIAATVVFHGGTHERAVFLTNLAVLGGLLHVVALGAGDASFDARRRPA